MSLICAARSSARFLFPLVLLAAGCTSSTPDCPVYDVGAIEGRILGGGLPVSARIRVRPFDSASHSDLEVMSDSSGSYAIPVPSGAYYVEVHTNSTDIVYGPAGGRWDATKGDTVHVGRNIVRADVTVGRLDIEIQSLPPFSGGFMCELYEYGGLQNVYRASQYASPSGDGVLRFSFPAVPSGTYLLHFRTEYSSLWLPGSLDPVDADRIRIGESAPATYATRVDSWGRIPGHVVGCWTDTDGPALMAFAADSALAGTCYGAGDGSFEMDLLLAQPVRICVERRGVSRWVGGPDFHGARVFDLHARETLDDLRVVDSGIECEFDDPVHGGVGFRVTLVGDTGYLHVRGTYFETPLRIPNLEPGSYRLRLDPGGQNGWLPQWYGGGDSASAATPIVISQPGEIARITIHMIEGGKIQGRITNEAGDSISGREVFTQVADGSSYRRTGDISDFQGRFSVIGLVDGDYLVGVEASDRAVSWYPGTPDPDAAERVSVRDHGVVEGIEWRVP